ncbi:TPA: hypothetical protein ACSPJ7_005553 [Bacillus cereus]
MNGGCDNTMGEVEYKLGMESGEALLLLNLIYYLEGKVELEQIVYIKVKECGMRMDEKQLLLVIT